MKEPAHDPPKQKCVEYAFAEPYCTHLDRNHETRRHVSAE
ncbi:Uncharacterised protein [Vibrio cholerae]|nr:Uncharacterised protein [Vibrio cholerae]